MMPKIALAKAKLGDAMKFFIDSLWVNRFTRSVLAFNRHQHSGKADSDTYSPSIEI